MIKEGKYTFKDGKNVVTFLKNHGYKNPTLIGSLSRGKESEHDIDILLPNNKLNWWTRNRLLKIFGTTYYSYTDWKGLCLTDTYFGNVDIFFTTEEFDN